MADNDAAAPEDLVTIDTSILARPRPGLTGRTSFTAKLIALYCVGLVAIGLWIFVVIVATAKISEAAGGAAEVIIALVGLAIAGFPIGYALYLIIRFRNRHFSGVGVLIAPSDFTDVELARVVPHLGVPLRTVIEKVGNFARGLGAAPPPFKETDPAKLRKSRGIKLGLLAAGVGGMALYAATESVPALLPVLIAVVGYPWSLREAQQAVQPTLDQVRARDPRKPVLLLRSFQDDVIQINHRVPSRIGETLQPRRFEQDLAGMLEAFGPLVAIGKPGEELPQIGAARSYFSESEWQPAVMRLMGEALFIAMIAGSTEMIRWELARILEMGRVRNLMILVPPVPGKGNWEMAQPANPEQRWKNVLDALAGTRWQPMLQALDTAGLLLVLLRPDGKVVAIRRGGKAPPWADDYQLALAIALYEEFCRTETARA